ncbi:MAG TPA: sugar dehydrogenase complex small subunit [Gemmatimonadales bacterium]|nr:sugar dehydrogenase complex small subunit [Gemmatimonadales bacterium]
MPISRRGLLVTGARLAAAVWAGGLGPLGLDRLGPGRPGRPGSGAPGPPELATFMAVSRRLTGKRDLDPAFGAQLYAAFARTDPAVTASLTALATLLGPDGAAVGPGLARAPQPLRAAAQRLLRGWYLGLVGEGDATRCVAYETILGYRPVADVVVMQTFCRGRPGYWTARALETTDAG